MILIPVIILHTPSNSRAQWTHLATHIFNSNPGSSGGTLYFKDGVLWGGLRQILYSRDTGKTWNVSLNSMTGGETVMNFDFYNSLQGLCRTANHLYITQNGGASWTVQNTPGNPGSRYSIFAGTSNIIISLAQDGIYVSNDVGITWAKRYSGLNPNIAAYKDYGTIAVFEASAPRLVVSHDFGQTWIVKPIDVNIADSYSMQWDKCDPGLLYLTNEDYFGHNQNRSEVFGTGNEGDTWVSFIKKPFGLFNGGMTISTTAAYFQSLNEGVFVTTDKGTTWDSLYGPSNYPDTRWLASINSKILIAIDQNGDVWQLNTGSTGATPNFVVPRELAITNCRYDSLLVKIKGLRCKNFIVRNAFITGKDTSLYKLRTTGTLPLTITPNNDADFIINFDPQYKVGSYSDSLHIIWEDGETAVRHDTVFLLHTDVSQALNACIVSPKVLIFDTISPCHPELDTIVRISNNGCDTLTILNQPNQLIVGFTFDSLKLPLTLPPDSSVNVIYHFRPILPGWYQATSLITVNDKGIDQSLSVLLSGSASQTNFTSAGIDSLINLDTVSLCAPSADSSITLTNLSCVPMRLIKQFVLSGYGFSIDSLNYPISIPSGSSVRIPIHFQPLWVGVYSQRVQFEADWTGFGLRKLDLQLHGVCSESKVGPIVSDTSVDFGSTTMCSPSRDTIIPFFNRSCDTLIIVSGSITGTGFSVSNLSFPIILPPSSGVMITFHYTPITKGIYQAKMRFMTLRGGGKKQELSISLIGSTIYSTALQPLPDQNIDLGRIAYCDDVRDTIIKITNQACDTLKIISAPGNLSSGFSMEPISLPLAIPPDSSINIIFHFRPSAIGSFTIVPHFEFEQESLTTPLDLFLKCDVGPGKSVFSLLTPKISFTPLSICSTDSAEIIYTNSGCDTLYVTPNGLNGDSDFIATTDIERAMGRGDTIHIRIHFVPSLKGGRSAQYNLHCRHRSGEIKDTSIAITGVVTDGSKLLISQLTNIAFDATGLCSTSDSTLLLTNRGCDTLLISAAQLVGEGFDISGVSFPLIVPPNESSLLHILTILDTMGRRPGSQAKLTFTSTSDQPLDPITLTHSYLYPTNYPLHLQVVTDSLKAGDTFILRILADSLPKDLVRFDAKLTVGNPDMLFLIPSQNKNSISLHGDSITITGNPIISENTILAELAYRVFLSKDSVTDLILSDIHFNPLDYDYEKCMALSSSTSQTEFHHGFECGDRILMMEMNGGITPKIFSLRPNPAHRKIDLDLKTLTNEDIDVSIVDAKGMLVFRELRHHPKGRSAMAIDVSSLSSGAYFVKLDAGGSHLSTTFIKEK